MTDVLPACNCSDITLSESHDIAHSFLRYNHGHLIRYLASLGADLNQEECEHCYSPLTLSLVLVRLTHCHITYIAYLECTAKTIVISRMVLLKYLVTSGTLLGCF